MDGHKKKASLEELRRLRKEGGTHFKSVDITADLPVGDEPAKADGHEYSDSDYGDAEDLHDFIEDAGNLKGKRVPNKRDLPLQHRPLASFFKKTSSKSSGRKSEVNAGGGEKDDSYFRSLMERFDEDEDSSTSEESSSEWERQMEFSPQSDLPQPSKGLDSLVVAGSMADTPNDMVPPSEMFAPFDPAVLNADVVKQLEEEEGWAGIDLDMTGLEPVLMEAEGRKQAELEDLGDFLKENDAPCDLDNSNIVVPMEIDNTPIHGSSLEYSPPGEGLVDFYWIDAFERSTTGTVYLFGKARQPDGSFASCCVTVTNIQRNLFFLPREYVLGPNGEVTGEEVSLAAVQTEISELMGRYKVHRFGCKRVTRKYAFEVADIPHEADWIKVIYAFSSPQLPSNLSGRTFSNVFGSNTSALELLLLKKRMMGPCWLRVKPSSMARQGVSWCRMELMVEDPKTCLSVITNGPDAPPLTVMSLSLRTVLNAHQQHELIAASGLIFQSVSPDSSTSSTTKCNAMFTVVCDPEGAGFPAKFSDTLSKAYSTRLELAKNERALLSFLIAMLHKHDPDVLVGHNFLGFDLGVLLHRMKACKVEFWSRLGRLNWSQWPKAKAGSNESSWSERQILSGRLACDTWLAAKDLVKAKNYSLETLVQQVLGETPIVDQSLQVFGQDPMKVKRLFETPEGLLKLLRRTEKDAYHQIMLMFRLMVLPLTKQLTNIAGNLWSRTLAGARAERNEFLLLHEFHQAKYICPDKTKFVTTEEPRHPTADEDADGDGDDQVAAGKKGQGRRKPAYAGGLVLEPKRGFYDKIVLLLDFNSLYPSIIQEYNICFTTVARDPNNLDEMPEVPDPEEAQGVLPRVLKALVEKRGAVKRLMKDPKTPPQLLAQYNIRQQALKLTANSMYGCLGFSHSRFYAKPLAMLITSRGRDILQSTVQLAQQACHLDVIYGDTDSIMINTGCTDLIQAKRLAHQVKRVVNEKYRLLEIELDGIFEKLLLLRKKKYAALIIEESINPSNGKQELTKKLETKGLDMVRRDWSQLSVHASDYVLQQMMFSPGSAEEIVSSIHTHLEELATQIRTPGTIPLEQFIISKNLTKDPESYADAKGQPHVTIALRMKAKGMQAKSGDTIPYVICLADSTPGGNSSSLSDRAFHPDEVKANPASLQIDAQWYLAQQVHPPVSRLCECVEGTDSARLAMCLGLDSRKYSSLTGASNGGLNHNGGEDGLMSLALLSDEEKFKHVTKLMLVCTECHSSFEFTGPLRATSNEDQTTVALVNGMQCPSCSHQLPPQTIYCQVLGLIRSSLTAYHQFWLQCDEPSCNTLTRRMRVYETRCTNDACRGSLRPKIPGSQPYHQLLYLRSLFDWDRAKAKIQTGGSKEAEQLHALKRLATEYEPVRAMILHQLNQCSFPIISLRDIFSFMTVNPKQ